MWSPHPSEWGADAFGWLRGLVERPIEGRAAGRLLAVDRVRPRMRGTFIGIRKGLGQRNGRLLLGLRLLMICLGATALVLLWEGLEGPFPAEAPRSTASPEEPVPAKAEKFTDRTETALVAEALSQPGSDVSHLASFELGPPYISRDGTTLMQGARQLRFHGIEGPHAAEVCLDEQGGRWACGLQARAALHNLLAGGLLTCTPQLALGNGNVSVSCLVKTTVDGSAKDVAQALVGRGWARLCFGVQV